LILNNLLSSPLVGLPLVIRVGAYPHREQETVAWEQASFENEGLEYEFHDGLTSQARRRLGGASAVISSGIGVAWPEETVALLDNCRVLVSCTVGLDSVDTAACDRRKIQVVNMPAICTDEVADHTLALILASLRKIPRLTEHVHDGRWNRSLLEPMPRLRGLTLGLVGLGRIGRAVASRAAPFGFVVIGHDPYVAATSEVPVVELSELCARSDVISLHVPLLPSTEGILGEGEFALMKPTALIVNTSRGGLVDGVALARALEGGRVGAAALDVLEHEPPHPDDPLLRLDNVIVTPHAGGYSDEVVWDIPKAAVDAVLAALRSERPDATRYES
jgi:D-3-phosphoglycerate dehydrogenase